MMQHRRHGRGGNPIQITAKMAMLVLAIIFTAGSVLYWWQVQSLFTPNWIVAGLMALIVGLGPSVLTSFLIPWSPAGMLFQRIQSKQYGYAALTAGALILVAYAVSTSYNWWYVQPIALAGGVTSTLGEVGMAWQQVLAMFVGFVIIPALVWTPVTDEELIEQIRQEHLVRRYELQTQADIAILRATLMRAQEKALIGFANLTVEEKEELAGVMRGLVLGVGESLRQVGASVKRLTGAALPFDGLEDRDDIVDYLEYIHQSLVDDSQIAKAQERARTSGPVRVERSPEQDARALAFAEHEQRVAQERLAPGPQRGEIPEAPRATQMVRERGRRLTRVSRD